MNDRLGIDNRNGDSTPSSRGCERAEDLVTYLYGETAPSEARSFASHLDACAPCRDEMAAFGVMRTKVGALREELVSVTPRIDFAAAFGAESSARTRVARKRSALAALREFFTLSPLWLRAGSVAATVAVCALAALTFARTEMRWDENGIAFRMGVPAQTIEKRVEAPASGMFTEQQVNEIADERAAQALEAFRSSLSGKQERQTIEASTSATPNRVTPVLVKGEPRRRQATNRKSGRRQGLEYELIVEDEGLPRLYDLLREAN